MRYYKDKEYFLDYHTIRKELNISEAKLIRTIQTLEIPTVQYKNQRLVAESDFIIITEATRKNNSY